MCTETTRSDSTPIQPFGDGGGYDPATGTYHASFDEDVDADAVVVTIVSTVAGATDRELTEMPPLYGAVDAEALTRLVTSSREQSVEVTFSYVRCRVTVSSRGDVVVDPLEE